MPTYTYEDEATGERYEFVFPMGKAPDAIRHKFIENRWAKRIIAHAPGFKMDSGRLFSPAFNKEFRNEKDMRDYAKHNGFIPVENASAESMEQWDKANAVERETKLYKDIAESVQWDEVTNGH